jgi:FMN phosphatase YigB (HAD superfamily)
MRRAGEAAAIVWDFDGTLYCGPEACRHYARGIAETLPRDRREPYLDALDRYLAGEGGVTAADGWEAAVVLAGGAHGASRAYADEFARTRAFMLSDECELSVPDGLPDLLERLEGRARRVLVSNTPAYGVMSLLERIGLTRFLDEIVCDAAKPHRFAVRLRAVADVLDVDPRAVLSVGDHFVNDIGPAIAAGCSTAYVDPFGVGPAGRTDLYAPRLEDLLEPIEAWVEQQYADSAKAVAG